MDSQLRKRRMVGGVEKVVNICSFETLKNLQKLTKEIRRERTILLLIQRVRISKKERSLKIWPVCMDVDMSIRTAARGLNPPSPKNYQV